MQRHEMRLILKEVFIDLLYLQCLLGSTAHTMLDHEITEPSTVDQDDTLAQVFGCLFGVLREVGCRDEHALRGLEAVERSRLPKKSRIADAPILLSGAYRLAWI